MSGAAARADRFEFIDALRGFALFGVFAANLLIFSGIDYLSDAQRAAAFPGALDRIAFAIERFFIETKFMGLFSTLFGISFWLFLDRVGAREAAPTRRFYRRISWLFVIGAVHGWLLWCFDILRFYALWAVLLPVFVRTRPRRLLAAALAAGVLLPALVAGVEAMLPPPAAGADDALALAAFSQGDYAAMLKANWDYDWYLTLSVGQLGYQIAILGRLLLGLVIARTFAFADLERHRALLWNVLIAGGAIGMVGNAIYAGEMMDGHAPLTAFAREILVQSGYLGFTLAYASFLALAYLRARGRSMVRLLAPLGRMALTWYLAQTLFGLWLFYGFAPGPGLMGKVGPAALCAICVAGYVAQVAMARAWLSRFRFGPMEWLWRTLTYGKAQPLRIVPSEARVPV